MKSFLILLGAVIVIALLKYAGIFSQRLNEQNPNSLPPKDDETPEKKQLEK